ncbi:putative tellurite resistance protein B-like protein [Litorivivens lipolytica]|uniref:Putative tellurite resistance protein B-like protein n=1 Tax=Litorivivens lipolytica TaxID=1524264 RepID=A0A7W4W290_9GAMM|nr:TerB family tellurite resistance protein [Litorivivens lipolytica]MBB3046056.1 putative tellurite resistance protein B-like protein [Litorivivens lipolytica]
MLRKLQQFFTEQMAPQDSGDVEHRLRLATAALLIELSKADFEQDSSEREAIEQLLQRDHGVTADEIETLMALAEEQFAEDNAYHPYTSLINEHFSPEQKVALIDTLWQVAIADGEISKYEDHLIRKISKLIYVPHREFIRSKLKVTENGH